MQNQSELVRSGRLVSPQYRCVSVAPGYHPPPELGVESPQLGRPGVPSLASYVCDNTQQRNNERRGGNVMPVGRSVVFASIKIKGRAPGEASGGETEHPRKVPETLPSHRAVSRLCRGDPSETT